MQNHLGKPLGLLLMKHSLIELNEVNLFSATEYVSIRLASNNKKMT